jgi:beta-glucosidase
MNFYIRLISSVVSFFVIISTPVVSHAHEFIDGYHWDWNSINTQAISFPQDFLFGVATSSYQVEGGNVNVWDRWAQEGKCSQAAGNACDHWNKYKEDVQLIKNVHANAYRFSVEWSRIEPQEGIFDESALDHYATVCDELLAHGIAPIITIHHYNDPIWFLDLGGFEKEENIQYYVRFAKKLIDRLHDKVHLWLTFNSPSSYAAKAYLKGMMPPGKKHMQLMAEVMKNQLCAHVRLYKAVKADPLCAHAKVGTLHNICQLEARWFWNKPFAWLGEYITHTCVYNFFRTGTFRFYIPGLAYVSHAEPGAEQSLDFIGLNYYTHMLMSGSKAQQFPGEQKTASNDKTIYPEGFYRAIKELWEKLAEPLNIPIYVTENGIAPLKEEDRDLFLRRYFYALYRAMSEGCDVRGYCYWSLMDNYEWGTLGKKCYGLYHVDFETFKRTLKSSARYFIEVAKRFGNEFIIKP